MNDFELFSPSGHRIETDRENPDLGEQSLCGLNESESSGEPVDSLLDGLNLQQRRAVESKSDALLIGAGGGR